MQKIEIINKIYDIKRFMYCTIQHKSYKIKENNMLF